MSGFKYPKGSEWRKWDLHVHTPASVLNKQYGTNDENTWGKFVDELENRSKEYGIHAIGIGNYQAVLR